MMFSLSFPLIDRAFCLSFPLIDRAAAPGQYEQSYLNVKTLTKIFLIPNNKSFKDAIRSDLIGNTIPVTPFVYSIRW